MAASDTQSTEDVFLTLRVPRELRDAINALAEQNERTQAAEIRVALKNHLTRPSRQED